MKKRKYLEMKTILLLLFSILLLFISSVLWTYDYAWQKVSEHICKEFDLKSNTYYSLSSNQIKEITRTNFFCYDPKLDEYKGINLNIRE